MKKFLWSIFAIWAVASAVLLAGNVYYYKRACNEARMVTRMATAMEREGVIDRGTKLRVWHHVRRQHYIMYPARSYQRMQALRKNLQTIRRNYQPKSEEVCYKTLSIQTTRIEKL